MLLSAYFWPETISNPPTPLDNKERKNYNETMSDKENIRAIKRYLRQLIPKDVLPVKNCLARKLIFFYAVKKYFVLKYGK